MGFFDKLTSITRSFGSAVVATAKSAASKAIHFVAENAEKFVGSVKNAWEKVKPYVEKAQKPLKHLAQKASAVPYAGAVLTALSIGVDALLALENSPVLKKAGETIIKIGNLAKNLEEKIRNGEIPWLTPEEYEQAIADRETLRKAEEFTSDLSEAQQTSIEFANAINNLRIARKDLQQAIEAGPRSYEHYLRLRATQKLISIEERKLIGAGSLDALNRDDYFIIRIASDLITEDAEMSTTAAQRIDSILNERYGKTLQSFVYEELVAIWVKQGEELESEVQGIIEVISKKKVRMKRLINAKRLQLEIDEAEALELSRLEKEVPEMEMQLQSTSTRQMDAERYADAAEGFLQVLEKTPEQLEAEGRSYVLVEGPRVGELIIKAAQQEIPFEQLSEEEQETINDFANIFREDAKSRMASILEVAA